MTTIDVDAAFTLVRKEYIYASTIHPPFHSAHEGYAIIKEELDELWALIRTIPHIDHRPPELRLEATQIAAMAIRFLVDLCSDDRGDPS